MTHDMKLFFIKILCWLARAVVQKYHPRIVSVTGSIGKTSTKEAIKTVLGPKFRVRAAVKNYNTESGLALTIFGLSCPRYFFGWILILTRALRLLLWRDTAYPEVLILEMAADRPGDLRRLVAVATPEVAVVTAVGSAHLEFFGSLEKIAREKFVVPGSVGKNGLVVLNHDDVLVLAMRTKLKVPVKTYGLGEAADVRAIELNIWEADDEYPRSLQGLRCKVSLEGSVVPVAVAGAVGPGVARAILAALAVGQHFGLHAVEMAEALTIHVPPSGRMHLVPGVKGTMLIDDTYNASPEAVTSAIQVLAGLPLSRKLVVLGDMLELGHETVDAHHAIGRLVAENNFDLLLTVGQTSRLIGVAAQHRGMDVRKITHVESAEVAGLWLKKFLQKGDVVLVKGSQAMRMEKVVKELMAEPLHACDLLVRQDAEWL